MAADMNTVNLVGRCTRAPELKATGSTSVLGIRLAFTTQRKAGDRWEDQPNYVDVTVFGRRAEALANLLDKGDRIGITGRLSWREWESKDGKRQAIEVVANDVQLLGAPREQGQQSAPANDLPVAPAPVQPVPAANDDIPF
jgi:single-strand DNA-binding protein